jgi:hypothetical protein
MANASTALASPDIHMPHLALPKFRWPHLSRRARALLMLGLMISPTFLADDIGYCVQRLFMTADQIDEKQAPDSTMLSKVSLFHVACTEKDMPAAERRHWAETAAWNGWPQYPEAGPGCFKPDRNLFGIVGLKAFNVACPTAILSFADQRRWVAFTANHGWTEYHQAGDGCVDP